LDFRVMAMVPVNAVRKGQKKKKSKNNAVNPSPNATIYTGPLTMGILGRQENDVMTTQINVINAVATNGSGVINTVFDFSSQVQANSDWSSFAATWGEFRILSGRIMLTPWNTFNTPTTTVLAPLYTVVDRLNSTAIASLATVANYASSEQHLPSTVVVRSAKMEGTDEAQWTDVAATPNDRIFIKLYSTGNTASLTLYDYYNSYMVQFRGRR